jgi:tetratricopeptide (TPR) repeat protein
VQWAADHFRKWYGQAHKPHYGTTFAAARTGDPGAGPELARLSGDRLQPAIVRATALDHLGAYPGPRSREAFESALGDEEPIVRYTALGSLGEMEPAELVDLVAPLLFDPVRGIRMEAASRLAGIPEDLLKPYQKEALDETLPEYRRAMEYSLDFAFAGHNLANLEMRLGRPEKAASYYKAALEIDDLFYPAKVNLAMLFNSMGRNEEAATLFREILAAYPEMHETAYSLGLLLAEMNRFEEAAGYLEQASRGMPGRARVHYNLGLLLQQLGRIEEAETALRRAVDAEPDSLDLLYALADHHLRRGEYLRAEGIAEQMTAIHPDDPLGGRILAFIEEARRRSGQEHPASP